MFFPSNFYVHIASNYNWTFTWSEFLEWTTTWYYPPPTTPNNKTLSVLYQPLNRAIRQYVQRLHKTWLVVHALNFLENTCMQEYWLKTLNRSILVRIANVWIWFWYWKGSRSVGCIYIRIYMNTDSIISYILKKLNTNHRAISLV